MATRTFDLSRRWVAAGHPTTVFASDFSHYTFQYMHRMPWYRLWLEEDIDGVHMVWLKTTPYRLNDFRRAINMASFAVLAFSAGALRRPRPGLVIGVSVHPLAALSGWMLAVIRRARFFFEETDLWPQTLIDLGLLQKDSLIARGLRSIEAFLYRRAERIVMLWRDTAPYVDSLAGSALKIVWVPHGVELSRYRNLAPYDGAPGRPFRVMYLGGFVMSMALGTILEAAMILQKRGRNDIRFLLVGSGTDRDELIHRAQDSGLSNVEFPPPVPKDEIASVMSSADAFIYGVRDLPLYRYGMSLNKLMDYLAGARPIVYSGNSSYNPVEIANAGFTVAPENAAAVADAVERLVAMSPEDRIAMGRRGHEYLLKNHDIEALATRLLDEIVLA